MGHEEVMWVGVSGCHCCWYHGLVMLQFFSPRPITIECVGVRSSNLTGRFKKTTR